MFGISLSASYGNKGGTKKTLTSLRLVYLIGFLTVVAELIHKIQGRSLCPTEGCRVVENFVRGGEVVLLIVGLLLFGTLFLLSLLRKSETLHSVILISALTVEGYLVGFQSFVLGEFCLLCLFVFLMIVIASLLRLIEGRKEVAIAFIGFASVFFITFLVNPKLTELSSKSPVLIYAKNCPSCKEIIEFCRVNKIDVNKVEATKVVGLLKSLNINSVPVLYTNESSERRFIIGADRIREYLLAKVPPKESSTGEVCPIFTPKECK